MNFTAAQITALKTGIDASLGNIQTKITNTVFAETLPLIGANLAQSSGNHDPSTQHIVAIKTAVAQALGGLGANPSDTALANAINGALNGTGTSVIVSDSGGEVKLSFVGGKTYSAGNLIAGDLGMPGLGVQVVGASVPTDVSYTNNFTVGLNGANKDAFFFDASSDFIRVSVDADGSQLNNATGKLNGLPATISTTGTATGFSGAFRVDVAGAKLTKSAAASAAATTTLSGQLDGELHVLTDVGVGVLPDIDTTVKVGWDFANAAVNGAKANDASFGNVPSVSLESGLVLSSFFGEFIDPVFSKIKTVTDPIKPVVDALSISIPFLSGLGLPSTLADFMGIGSEVRTLKAVIDFVDAGAEAADVAKVNLGKLTYGATQDIRAAGFDPASLDFSQANFEAATDVSVQSAALARLLSIGAAPAAAAFGPAEAAGISVGGATFSFPILDTTKPGVFDLLAGKTTDLLFADLPQLNAGFNFSEFYPIIGPLGARVEGGINLNVDLDFGFDSSGLNAFRNGGSASQIFNGFYISDHWVGKKDGPELTVSANIQAFAELNLALARAGVGGGLFANIFFDLVDVKKDGRIYLDELQQTISNGDVFDTSGNVSAGLSAYLKVGFGPFSKTFRKNLASVTLLEFGVRDPAATTPKLAHIEGGNLVLNVGANAEARVFGDLDDDAGDLDENGAIDRIGDILVVNSVNGQLAVTHSRPGDTETAPRTELTVAYPSAGKIIVAGGHENPQLIQVNQSVTKNLDFTAGDGVAQVYGGSGNDVLKGSTFNDSLGGGKGNDVLIGNNGADSLFGNEGNDQFIGGRGDDTMDGGAGADYLFGGPGFDKVTYASSVGGIALYLDAPKKSTGDAKGDTLIAIEEVEGSNSADALYGNKFANYLAGGGGDDILDGGEGNDSLEGGNGEDILIGGPGIDTAIYSGTAVTVNLATGVGTFDAFGDSLSGIENLLGGNGDDTFIGSSIGNVLNGGAGNDSLNGGGGKDTLIGGLGNDTLVGDGDDVVSYEDAGNRVIVDLEQGTAEERATAQTPTTTDTLTGIRDVIGSYFNDDIYGDDNDNRIDPKLSREAPGSEDLVDGGGGTDTLVIDYSMGDSPTDLFSNAPAGTFPVLSGVIINRAGNIFNVSRQLNGANFDVVLVQDVEQIDFTGGRQDDDIVGFDGADTLRGGGGDDTLNGATGHDFLFGGDGNDRLIVDDRGDTVFGGQADDVTGGAGDDTLVADFSTKNAVVFTRANSVRSENNFSRERVAEVNYSEIEHLNITGGIYGDTLTGRSGGDTLNGGFGNDTLTGGGGSDSLDGGFGDDVLSVNPLGGDSFVDGGSSALDRLELDYSASPKPMLGINDDGGFLYAGDIVKLQSTYLVNNSLGSVHFQNIERLNLIGTKFNDVFFGGSEVDAVLAGAGNDSIGGGSGDDFLFGGDGNDTLAGGLGADEMRGGKGNDTYFADYEGANVEDTLIENPNAGYDVVIISGEGWFLDPNFEELRIKSASPAYGHGNDSANKLVAATSASVSLYGGEGNDILIGGSAADLLDGEDGTDTMQGRDGGDTYYVDDKNDKIIELAAAGGIDKVFAAVSYTLPKSVENMVLTGTALKATGNSIANVIVGNFEKNILEGGAGDDVLVGGEKADGWSGANSVDSLYGGAGADTYILGNSNRPYYIATGKTDYAAIDFKLKDGDKLELHGTEADYFLRPITKTFDPAFLPGTAKLTGLFFDRNDNSIFDSGIDDLMAVLPKIPGSIDVGDIAHFIGGV